MCVYVGPKLLNLFMTRSFYLICEVHCLLQHSETTHYNYIVTLVCFKCVYMNLRISFLM